MRRCRAIVMGLACGLLIGCQTDREGDAARQPQQNLDVELVKTLNNVGIDSAIITQHTLYPYHFVPDGDTLNDLGRRDLAVLAKHYAEHPGVLNIRRDRTPRELYDARIASALTALKDAGVQTERMSISDNMPGGPGMPSERVVTILQSTAEPSLPARADSSMGTITR